MLYLIGLGMDLEGISLEGLRAIERCKKVYLENYTASLPYSKEKLEKTIRKTIIPANREFIESFRIIGEAKKENVALLIYGNPLAATTHITLVHEARKKKIKCEIIHGASIWDAIAETGLQLYKFGKTSSIPKWKKECGYEPTSFAEIIKQNLSINAHTLLLVDPGLEFRECLKELKESAKKHKIKIDKIIVCQKLGTKESKVIYIDFKKCEKLKEVKKPYCIIIPSKLHFTEEEFLESCISRDTKI